MEFEQWAEADGWNIEGLDADNNIATLKAVFQREQEHVASESAAGSEAATAVADPPSDPVDEMRSQAASESRRIAAIGRVCAGEHAEIEVYSESFLCAASSLGPQVYLSGIPLHLADGAFVVTVGHLVELFTDPVSAQGQDRKAIKHPQFLPRGHLILHRRVGVIRDVTIAQD